MITDNFTKIKVFTIKKKIYIMTHILNDMCPKDAPKTRIASDLEYAVYITLLFRTLSYSE